MSELNASLLNTSLNLLGTVAADPAAMLKKYLGEGKKVVGCFPLYTPAELVYAAGMIPMGLWGGEVVPAVAGRYAPIFTCSILRSCLELGMTAKYAGLSAVLMPMLCDSFRGHSGAWRAGVKDIPLIAFIHPQNRTDPASLDFLVAEYDEVKKKIEAVAGREITAKALEGAIEIYNKHNQVMREFALLANDHLDVITPAVRHNVMKSAHFMDKKQHSAVVATINAALKERPVHPWRGKRIVLTGITAEPANLLDIFAENQIAVVGDDLAQESRQYRTDIPASGSPLERLAKQWMERKGCPSVHETSSVRFDMIVDIAKENKANGVAVCLMKFCDLEEYDYPNILKKCEAAGLTVICLDIDQSIQVDEQSRTKIQSFAEMIG